MNRTQVEHVIRVANQISSDAEIIVVGSQPIHAQSMKLPPIAFQSDEADVYPRNRPERADEIDAAIGELSPFHDTHGYYGHGVSPATTILPHPSRIMNLYARRASAVNFRIHAMPCRPNSRTVSGDGQGVASAMPTNRTAIS